MAKYALSLQLIFSLILNLCQKLQLFYYELRHLIIHPAPITPVPITVTIIYIIRHDYSLYDGSMASHLLSKAGHSFGPGEKASYVFTVFSHKDFAAVSNFKPEP